MIGDRQRKQRELRLCEDDGDPREDCDRTARWIVSPRSSPIDSKRLCQVHAERYRANRKLFHAAPLR